MHAHAAFHGLIWSIAGVQGFAIVVCAVDAVWSYRMSKRDWSMANSVNGKVQVRNSTVFGTVWHLAQLEIPSENLEDMNERVQYGNHAIFSQKL